MKGKTFKYKSKYGGEAVGKIDHIQLVNQYCLMTGEYIGDTKYAVSTKGIVYKLDEIEVL